jgi:type IV pilus assembly protein PilC
MEIFNYTAVKSDGALEKGIVSAVDIKDAAQQIRQMNLRIVKIIEGGNSKAIVRVAGSPKRKENLFNKLFGEKIPIKDLAIFTNQMGTMLNAGLSITKVLDVLSKQGGNKKIQKCAEALKRSVEGGLNLSEAMKEFPEVFDNLFVSMVKAGEGMGGMGDSLIKMAIFKQREATLRSKIKSAMNYPIIVFGASISIVLILFIFVLPKFVGFLTGMNVPLPLPTRITLAMSDFLTKKWYIILGVMTPLLLALRMFFKTDRGIAFRDNSLIRMPIVGPLIIKNSMSRFTDTLSTLFGAGVSLIQCMEMTAGTMGNTVIEATIVKAINLVKGGETLSTALSKNPFFTPMVVQMTRAGEESGYLGKMLGKVAEFYMEEVDTATSGLVATINPILMIGVGIMVGWVLISLYLPIFTMAGGIS